DKWHDCIEVTDRRFAGYQQVGTYINRKTSRSDRRDRRDPSASSPRSAATEQPTLAMDAACRYNPGPIGLRGTRRPRPTNMPGRTNMNRREILQGSAALALAAAGGINPATAQSPIVIKFSHVVAIDAPKGKASEK